PLYSCPSFSCLSPPATNRHAPTQPPTSESRPVISSNARTSPRRRGLQSRRSRIERTKKRKPLTKLQLLCLSHTRDHGCGSPARPPPSTQTRRPSEAKNWVTQNKEARSLSLMERSKAKIAPRAGTRSGRAVSSAHP